MPTKELTREELLERYGSVGRFQEGLAAVRKDGQWFHIKPDGTPSYKERYDSVDEFYEGLAAVRKDGQGFHVKPDGTRVEVT